MGKKQNPEQWEKHIRTWRKSELTRKAYCLKNDLTLSSFDYWSRRLKEQARENRSTMVRFSTSAQSAEFLAAANPTNRQSLKLHINQYWHIEIPSPINKEDVRTLLETIRELER